MPDVTIEQALAIALQHHQAGRLSDAEAIYRQILAHDPQHAGALHLLGTIAIQVGRNDIGIDLIGKSLAIEPQNADGQSNLSNALRNLGQVDQAIDAARAALRINPQFAAAYFNLANALTDQGYLDDAVAAFRAAIAIQPDYPEACCQLGKALGSQGQLEQAAAACETAIRLRPNYAAAHQALGNVRVALGQFDAAISAFRAALAIDPNNIKARNNLGAALDDTGRFDEAIAEFRVVIRLQPNYPEPYSNLANVLHKQGKFSEAVAACETSIRLKPDYAHAYYNLGNALMDLGRLDEAIASYQTAVRLNPDRAEAFTNMGVAFQHRGQFDEVIAAYRKAIEVKREQAKECKNLAATLKEVGRLEEAAAQSRKALQLRADDAAIHSNLIYMMLYEARNDHAMIAAEARCWAQQHEAPLRSTIVPHENDRTPDRRLRIGYVSADLCRHPIGRFMLPLLSAHDPDQFEIFVYSDLESADALTSELRGHADAWHEIAGMSAEEVAARVRQDRIDILVDLAGHTAHNRLPVFARKPAPVQVSYLGFPATTGLESIDYRLTDVHADPPDDAENEKRDYSEKLVRLPATTWCWRMPAEAPSAEREPGPFTFGCFSTFAKVSESMLRLWGRIVVASPESRFLLKSVSFMTASVRERVLRILGEEGVEPRRVELLGDVIPYSEHLALYRGVDVVLDTFPYHGTTTTCEALSMGVPVVSLVGDHHVSRVAVSLLTNVGLSEFLARTPEEYAEIVRKAANDPASLHHLRAGLRDRLAGSALTDERRFARDVEAAYRKMWKSWCELPAEA